MTTGSQKRKAVAELVSGDFETSITENFPPETLVASSSKIPRIEPESLAEIKTSLRKEIVSDLTKILAENQKEMLKLIAPLNKKQTVYMNAQDSESEPENVSVARTSTPVKIHTATNSKTTPVNSRNMVTESSITLPTNPRKDRNNNAHPTNRQKTVLQHLRSCSRHNRKHFQLPIYFRCRKHSLLRFQSSMVNPKNLNFLRTYSEIISKCTLT